ncbi:MAG: DUF4301 family protein [Bacteroidota bacterium]
MAQTLPTTLTSDDLQQMEDCGIQPEAVHAQLQRFETGFPTLVLDRPCLVGDGIRQLSAPQEQAVVARFEQEAGQRDIGLFVPASGAATRMFRDLLQFLGGDTRNESVHHLLTNLSHFAFYESLKLLMARSCIPVQDRDRRPEDTVTLIEHLITVKGLNYGNLPKAFIAFHRYPEGPRTALEEHLAEAAMYARDASDTVNIHFTISPAHHAMLRQQFEELSSSFARALGVQFNLTSSEQLNSTDTVAVLPDNTVYRTRAGKLLFRPAGHGALLENLNALEHDVVFIKNIDNILHGSQHAATAHYKKVLGGYLLDLQEKVFGFLRSLEAGAKGDQLQAALDFVQDELYWQLPEEIIYQRSALAGFLLRALNRPIRVCGMVRNEGQPGGGPFWVRHADNTVSPQIVEKAQINLAAADQSRIFQQSTHFNPVDLVCGVRDYKGKRFDLTRFRDPEMGFITEKSHEGTAIRGQELPGLWNGSMARWITVFVEVPLHTFGPVKTVNDLLGALHQPA